METLEQALANFNNFLWGSLFLVPLLCGTGLFYTIRLKFVQVRKFGMALRQVAKGASGSGQASRGMTSFQALATAIAAQVGTGNVAGTATAMALGGPGAIFWLWLAAFLGMATIFAEAVLAQVYKTTDRQGIPVGGPSWYITKGMGPRAKPLAVFFSIALIIALGFIGNMVQSNTIAEAWQGAFSLPRPVSAICTGILAALVFSGGMKRIARVTERLVPCMAVLYIAGGIYVLCLHPGALLPAFQAIVQGAFNPAAVLGGAAGISMREAMRYGIARGLFANEAGMGSTPHAHAVANVRHPCEQGLVAIFGVFTTLVIITFTALVILASGVMAQDTAVTGIRLTQSAYAIEMGAWGTRFVAVCLFFFAFSTIIGWYFFGAQNIRFLFNGQGVLAYRIIVLAFVSIGPLLRVHLVWQLADLCNGLMIIPNLIALWALNRTVVAKLAEFDAMTGKNNSGTP